MQKKETVYKIYEDINRMPKETMYLRPLGLGIGTGLGAFIASDNKTLFSVCVGAAVVLLGRGFYNACKFRKQKKPVELAQQRLEVFESEAKKIIGEDVNLDYDNVLARICLGLPDVSFVHYNTMFKDGGCMMESICDEDYNCEYFKLPENESEEVIGVDLSPAIDKAYSMVPSKNKKKRNNKNNK